ncbi:MAG: cytochrome d ubiquinol oxidase subunit II [Alphaproteobacteria bacterium]|nr:MAG: cytochrome d ubiquinol oxidase subunit II [Alphaproteobacteria bacterium]
MSHDWAQWLPMICGAVVAIAIFMYVMLDGFDLGVGLLMPMADGEDQRETMMNSVAPFWDGNETWLVLGGGGLLATFPLAFATLLPGLYGPVMLMLFALVFRGVAFEFRFKAQKKGRRVWDCCFWLGSSLAALAQGVMLGAFVQGFTLDAQGHIVGTPWLTWFCLFTGIGLACGYALLGACWLVLKAEGPLQARALLAARVLAFGLIIFIVGVSLWTPITQPEIAQRWFSLPNFLYLSQVPLFTAFLAGALLWSLHKRHQLMPFLCTIGLFLMSYLGLAVSLWPYTVPRVLTLWDTAAAPESQGFLLVGVVIFLPLVLFYTAFSFWVFRGKVRRHAGYE